MTALISPEAFQGAMIAWLGALTVVLGAIAAFAPRIFGLVQQVKESWDRLNRHSEDIREQSKQLTEVALATNNSPVTPNTPQEVNVVNTSSRPVPTTDTPKKGKNP